MSTSRPLTVAQVVPRLDSGGVERGTLEVAQALVEHGHRAIVISAGGAMARELERLGAEHVTMPVAAKSPLTLRQVGPMRRFLRERGVDIVHARSRVPAWVCWLAWRRMNPARRPRFVTTIHGLHSVSRYSSIMTRGEAVIAVSEAAREYAVTNYRVRSERLRVIHRGVDPQEFPHGFEPAPAWRERFFAEHPALAGRPMLAIIGRLTRLKGHHDFLTMMAGLRARGVDAAGAVVGGGDPRRRGYARELRERVRRENLDDRVAFTGERRDAREIAAEARIVLSLSSKPESFGRATLEALRLGTPVLGYDHGGVGEILSEVHPEGAVPLGDVRELVDRAATLLASPKRLAAPTDRFTKREMLERTLALYQELAEGRAPST